MLDRYGPPDVLRIATMPRPTPRRKQVVVQTRWVGINPKDVLVRKGKFKTFTGRSFPIVVGHDIAGEVVEAGPGADLAEGSSVYGMLNSFSGGAYAEYVTADCDAVATSPRTIGSDFAAAVPLAGQTALQALRDKARLAPGQSVLINGASGGVGVFAVQIAKILGAHVTAVCSERNRELVSSLGADSVVDYGTVDLTTLPNRFDVFFDVFGNYAFGRVKHLLRREGTYVQTIPSRRIVTDALFTWPSSKSAKLVIVKSRRTQLEWLTGHIDSGALKVIVDQRFPISGVVGAHRYIETKRARGKIVLNADSFS